MIELIVGKSAVADFGRVRLSGFIAWVLWSAAHIYFLIGFRRRIVVALRSPSVMIQIFCPFPVW